MSASISETGHAKNIANFQDLISFCQGYGTIYNPTKELLKIPQLQLLYQTSLNSLNTAKTGKTNFDNATNERRNSFSNLKPLSTKVINSFAVSGVDNLTLLDAKTINKKLQGTRKKSDEEATSTNATPTTRISTSQQSYDRLIDHFSSLIFLLEQNLVYNPNEEDLKVTSLQAKLNDLQSKNTNLINAYTSYSNSLINRNFELYNSPASLVKVSKEVKQYVKSIFGAKSPQYKQVSSLEFKVIKAE
ncbi:hypothetical protein [Flavobacterium sp.]|uniref:hypothetical protein n=1 Tax=Flavobacterium sp. TaxID=239 RepID=UPI0026186CA3|nr:hypothetical protein [Flavobacterium sp.]